MHFHEFFFVIFNLVMGNSADLHLARKYQFLNLFENVKVAQDARPPFPLFFLIKFELILNSHSMHCQAYNDVIGIPESRF